MSISKNKKQLGAGNTSKEQNVASAAHSAHSRTKLPGTRVGTLNDWRAGGAKGGSERSQHGKRLRDGQ
jgi:hypothetical protein